VRNLSANRIEGAHNDVDTGVDLERWTDPEFCLEAVEEMNDVLRLGDNSADVAFNPSEQHGWVN
jgi:hypothetical protein